LNQSHEGSPASTSDSAVQGFIGPRADRKEQLVQSTLFNRIGLAAMVGCIAVGSLAIAGCGGGDDTSTTGASGASGAGGGTPLTEEEFVSQANALCAEANQQVEALEPVPENAQSLSEAVPLLTQGVALARESSAKLNALVPPAELQDERDQLVANGKKELALAEKEVAAAKANDTAQFEAIRQQLDALSKEDDQIAKSIGLTECAKHVEPQGS
jgi:hypothetical protein